MAHILAVLSVLLAPAKLSDQRVRAIIRQRYGQEKLLRDRRGKQSNLVSTEQQQLRDQFVNLPC
jgi:hypothetical protein